MVVVLTWHHGNGYRVQEEKEWLQEDWSGPRLFPLGGVGAVPSLPAPARAPHYCDPRPPAWGTSSRDRPEGGGGAGAPYGEALPKYGYLPMLASSRTRP